jgi:hypothetical protein
MPGYPLEGLKDREDPKPKHDEASHDIMELCNMYCLLCDGDDCIEIQEAKNHLAKLIHGYVMDLAFDDEE